MTSIYWSSIFIWLVFFR